MKEDIKIPKHWKTSLEKADELAAKIKKGQVEEFSSAGGRKIYRIFYGKKNNFNKTANYSSACDSKDPVAYADKTKEDVRPTLFLVGAMHGFETEGTSAILNLIHVLETGVDYQGDEWPEFVELSEKCNIILIPFSNPDGRARVPYLTAEGLTLEEFRYYAQGTWADGSLCDWPECKKLHPMVGEKVGRLGAYYNDDGINQMYDLFPIPKAKETLLLMETVDEFVPDLTILLHGGANTIPMYIIPGGVHPYFRELANELQKRTAKSFEAEGLQMCVSDLGINKEHLIAPLKGYNMVSALTNLCGELCVTYESNQGLVPYNDRGITCTMDEIYKHHMIVFKECLKYACELKDGIHHRI